MRRTRGEMEEGRDDKEGTIRGEGEQAMRGDGGARRQGDGVTRQRGNQPGPLETNEGESRPTTANRNQRQRIKTNDSESRPTSVGDEERSQEDKEDLRRGRIDDELTMRRKSAAQHHKKE